MEPTIGRIVLVKDNGVVSPAIVCEVHGSVCISAQTFNRQGGAFVSSVLRSENLEGDNRCWDWMPFQKMVAAEREAEGKPVMAS